MLASLPLLALLVPVQGDAPEPRTVVIALEGLGHAQLAAAIEAGEVPNLARLANEGTFAPMLSLAPAEDPPAWATLNSGLPTSEHGVVGFVGVKNYPGLGPVPMKALSEDNVETPTDELANAPDLPGLPKSLPVTLNTNRAEPYWELAAKAGLPSVVLGGHQSWGRGDVQNLRALHRSGIPDANRNYVSYALYTADPEVTARDGSDRKARAVSGGLHLRVDERDGVIEAEVYGPTNFVEIGLCNEEISELTEGEQAEETSARIEAVQKRLDQLKQAPLTVPLKVTMTGDGSADVALGGETQNLGEGEWSDWYRMTFELSDAIEVHAITRAYLVSLESPHFALFIDAIEIDPSRPPFWQPLSQPAGFARELAEEFGPFSTVGWSSLTHAVKDGLLDIVVHLQDGANTMVQRERHALERMRRDDWRLFVTQLCSFDVLQHMLGQYTSTEHPLYDAGQARRTVELFGEQVPIHSTVQALVGELDRFVAQLEEHVLRPEDTLLIVSDFGQASFERQVHLNNWLAEQGYQRTKVGLHRSQAKMVHMHADLERTKAFSLGLGAIYLNEMNPEIEAMSVSSRRDFLEDLAADLLELRDPDHPEATVVSSVSLIHDRHHGPYTELEPDLIVGFEPPYRSSWLTAAGGISRTDGELGPTIVDNDRLWSSDHASVSPAAIPGLLLSNRPFALPKQGLTHLHLAPTVLNTLGHRPPRHMPERPLKPRD